MKAFFKTLIASLTRQGYPTIETWGSWEWKWDKNGNVKYFHWKSFFLHLKK